MQCICIDHGCQRVYADYLVILDLDMLCLNFEFNLNWNFTLHIWNVFQLSMAVTLNYYDVEIEFGEEKYMQNGRETEVIGDWLQGNYWSSYPLIPLYGSIRFAKKISRNTIPADLLWEKNIFGWKNKLKKTDYKRSEHGIHL